MQIALTEKTLIACAALGSAGLLIGAWGFQALGYAPCQMCIWQRYPHGAAVLIGGLFLVLPIASIAALGALAAATTGGIGVFHAGVEQGWWSGPSACSAGDIGGLSSADLLEQIINAPLVRCDEIAWQFLGLSMASWNAVISFALAALWLAAGPISRRWTNAG